MVLADLSSQVRINFIRTSYLSVTCSATNTWYHVAHWGPFPVQRKPSGDMPDFRCDVLAAASSATPTMDFKLVFGQLGALRAIAEGGSSAYIGSSVSGTTPTWTRSAGYSTGIGQSLMGDIIVKRQNHTEESVYPEIYAGMFVKTSAAPYDFRLYGVYLSEMVYPS